jgi:acyl-CoA hydrolase
MSFSVGSITTFVMPHMQNVRGDLFGGELMALVDQAAAVAAIRHAGGPAVTASIERVDFRERIPVGALVTCDATVDYVGNSSMDITVEVYSELVSTGERRHTHTAHVVFVALDEKGKPKRVPRLVPRTDEERARYARAEGHHQDKRKA